MRLAILFNRHYSPQSVSYYQKYIKRWACHVEIEWHDCGPFRRELIVSDDLPPGSEARLLGALYRLRNEDPAIHEVVFVKELEPS